MIKNILCLSSFLLLSLCAYTQDIVRFKISKPYCLLSFMNTCKGDRNASQGLVNFIHKDGILKDTAFQGILKEYSSIALEYAYTRDQFPEHRLRSRYGRISDLLVIAAVQSDDLRQFRERAIGLLPNTDFQSLFVVLEQAEPYYDRFIWQSSNVPLHSASASLSSYQSRISNLFSRLNHFYRATWTNNLPFWVSLYPVPANGGTAATPHNNVLCVGVRNGDKDYDGTAGIILHEMCHSLYNEQPATVQQDIERLFLQDTSRYGALAYSYFDEGLATACGNGWARESLNGKPDPHQWYNDRYVNGYGHGLFPLVKQYLEKNKTIDSTFVTEAINIFKGLLPKAPYDYELLMSNISLYTDAESNEERTNIHSALNRHFSVRSYNASSPIISSSSMEQMQSSIATQVIIIQKNAQENLKKLKEQFPELGELLKDKTDDNFIVSFYDQDQRPVIIVKTKTPDELEKAFSRLQKDAFMNSAAPYHPL